MPHEPLENALQNLAQVGERIARNEQREIWRFAFDGKPLHLHFYRRRKFRANPALRELRAFQLVQKAGIPSSHAVSAMIGFRLNGEIGDALLVEPIESDTKLEDFPHIQFRHQIIEILYQLARAGLGHDRLSLDCFTIANGKVFLTDARGVRCGGLRVDHLFTLARSASSIATKSDLLQVWREVGPDKPLPVHHTHSNPIWRRFMRTVSRDNDHFGRLDIEQWTGVFTRRAPREFSWTSASKYSFTTDDWQKAWSDLLAKIRSDQFQIIKRGDSGDVMAGEISLGDRAFSVIIKHPRRKFWWRYITELGRGSRAHRTWIKTWKMLIREIPCEWPMLLMERRRFGYAMDSILVFERVAGETLASAKLDAIEPHKREMLFRRAGKILRTIEDLGFTHTDAKSTNWIVFDDPKIGPRPILIDVDGVRHYRWSMMGIDRLLRAMKQHPQYTPADSMALCLGFAPRAKLSRDDTIGHTK